MSPSPRWHLYLPKLVTVLRQGYSFSTFRQDLVAGLTVAIVALPLAMALAIASGSTPEKGLHTAIIAGFLISAFGGSRVQIGGPTGAFIPVVFVVIQQHGYDGLVLATLMAGVILVIAGLMRVGALLRYIPQPVVTGFTAGIAVIIFSSQLKDLLGLSVGELPAEFIERMQVVGSHLHSINLWAFGLAMACLGLILALRRWLPRWPGFLLAVLFGAAIVAIAQLPVDTIGTRFPGGVPSELPAFHWPEITWLRLQQLLPAALTIAFLAGLESLLSALVADGMTGGRHRSNCELVAQGIANGASALFGGMPATGAIARTATNIRAGGRTPIAGMLHAVFLLLMMLLIAPWMVYIPMAALAAVLVVVAWNMSEVHRFAALLRSPWGDRLVLVVTFVLTVVVDLTVAIQVGIVMAAFLFMHRMAEVVEVQSHVKLVEDEVDDFVEGRIDDMRTRLPKGVEAFRIQGPLFFGAANRLDDLLQRLPEVPRIFILRMRLMPMIDASGVAALQQFIARCQQRGTQVILSGLQPEPRRVMANLGLAADDRDLIEARDFSDALSLARGILHSSSAVASPA